VVLLNDPWNVAGYLDYATAQNVDLPPIIAWLAVDAANQRGERLNEIAHVIVWTEYAADELRRGGYDGTPGIVPLGVDHSTFYPRDRTIARDIVTPAKVPRDAFIIGCVGRNQPRKRIDLTLAYFAAWMHEYRHTNTYLHLHVAPTGEQACDIQSLVRHYDIAERVIISKPDVGQGIPSEMLARVYSSFDVYLSTTQGEGWGLPCLEAMACGIPGIVPDYSGLGSWVGDAVCKVACTGSALSAPLNDYPYTIGGIADKRATVDALQSMYASTASTDYRDRYRKRGLALAAQLSWERTGELFETELLAAVERARTHARTHAHAHARSHAQCIRTDDLQLVQTATGGAASG
jgi:glycosyltransferase involved in cell wall biosynthesis